MAAGAVAKHPILAALGIAAALCIVGLIAVYVTTPAQQAPWALALVVFAYPFVAFGAWLVVNAIGWGKEVSGK